MNLTIKGFKMKIQRQIFKIKFYKSKKQNYMIFYKFSKENYKRKKQNLIIKTKLLRI